MVNSVFCQLHSIHTPAAAFTCFHSNFWCMQISCNACWNPCLYRANFTNLIFYRVTGEGTAIWTSFIKIILIMKLFLYHASWAQAIHSSKKILTMYKKHEICLPLTTVEVSEMLRTRLRVGDCMLSVISLSFSSCCSDSKASFFAKSIPDSQSSTYVPLSSNAPCVKTYNYSDTFSSHRTGI